MKTRLNCRHGFSKPLLLTSLAAIVGFALFANSQKRTKALGIEVTGLKSRVAELESGQLDPKELRRLRGQEKEIERLTKEAEEVHQYRGEITQLRNQKAAVEKMRSEIEPLRAAVRELATVKKQNAALQSSQENMLRANSQIQSQLLQTQRAAAGGQTPVDIARHNSCIANLKQMDGATQQWALETKKVATSPVEIASVMKYLKGGQLPVCPSKGAYSFSNVATSPRCSIHGGL